MTHGVSDAARKYKSARNARDGRDDGVEKRPVKPVVEKDGLIIGKSKFSRKKPYPAVFEIYSVVKRAGHGINKRIESQTSKEQENKYDYGVCEIDLPHKSARFLLHQKIPSPRVHQKIPSPVIFLLAKLLLSSKTTDMTPSNKDSAVAVEYCLEVNPSE